MDFTSSWKDGLAICALLHRHRPDLLNYSALASPTVTPRERLKEAFSIAAKTFHIPNLANPGDFIACCNDERCVIAVIATWYHQLNEYQSIRRSTSRLAVILDRAVKARRRMMTYVKEVYYLRRWIKANLTYLQELSGLKDVYIISSKLANWRKNEKPVKLEDIRQIEVGNSSSLRI